MGSSFTLEYLEKTTFKSLPLKPPIRLEKLKLVWKQPQCKIKGLCAVLKYNISEKWPSVIILRGSFFYFTPALDLLSCQRHLERDLKKELGVGSKLLWKKFIYKVKLPKLTLTINPQSTLANTIISQIPLFMISLRMCRYCQGDKISKICMCIKKKN